MVAFSQNIVRALPLLPFILFFGANAARLDGLESAPLNATTSSLLQSKHEPHTHLVLPCEEYLSDVIVCDRPAPRPLGAGGYGQTWLVQERATGSLAVLKASFTREKDRLLTRRDFLKSTYAVRTRLNIARDECELAMRLRRERADHPGAMHLMDCFGHNMDVQPGDTDLDAPVYTLLEFAGEWESDVFMNKQAEEGKPAFQNLRSIIRDVLQALACLSSGEPLYVHHDLKPENIMVKAHKGPMGPGREKSYSAHLIDFGGMARGDEYCKETVTTPFFAAPELGSTNGDCMSGVNFHPAHPAAYDMYSLAATWVQFTTSYVAQEILQGVHEAWCSHIAGAWCREQLGFGKPMFYSPETMDFVPPEFTVDECVAENDWCEKQGLAETSDGGYAVEDAGVFEHVLGHREYFLKKVMRYVETGSPEFVPIMQSLLGDEDALSFHNRMLDGLKVNPADRPTAEELLAHPFLQDAAEQRGEEAAEEAPEAEEAPQAEQPAAEDAGGEEEADELATDDASQEEGEGEGQPAAEADSTPEEQGRRDVPASFDRSMAFWREKSQAQAL